MAKKSSLAMPRPTGGTRPATMEELIRAVQNEALALPGVAQTLPVGRLRRGAHQPRRVPPEDATDPELQELAASIRTLGIIEPIAVRPLAESGGDYEILAGDRRWRAAQLAGLAEVPVIVHAVNDQTAAAMALVENLQRTDLNPLEVATAMQRLKDDFMLSQDQIGHLLGLSKSLVSKTLGLLSLASEVQALIRAGRLDAGHARLLINLEPALQCQLARRAVEAGWSVRELEQRKAALMGKWVGSSKAAGRRKAIPDPNLRRLETLMGEWLATPVRLKVEKAGKGAIVIKFSSTDECTGILRKIGFNLEEL
jgi:ParB family chromosome partitioning protein